MDGAGHISIEAETLESQMLRLEGTVSQVNEVISELVKRCER